MLYAVPTLQPSKSSRPKARVWGLVLGKRREQSPPCCGEWEYPDIRISSEGRGHFYRPTPRFGAQWPKAGAGPGCAPRSPPQPSDRGWGCGALCWQDHSLSGSVMGIPKPRSVERWSRSPWRCSQFAHLGLVGMGLEATFSRAGLPPFLEDQAPKNHMAP